MKSIKMMSVLLATGVLAACSSSDNDDADDQAPGGVQLDAQFEVRVTNLTNAQPFSPVAVMLHEPGFQSFVDGESASLALELLAEGGDNSDVLGEVEAASEFVAAGSTDGPVPPRSISPAVTLTVPTDSLPDLNISVISMLVHTNDGFTGTNATNISGMNVGDTRTMVGPTWDAGTEINSELGSTIPGPEFSGEGFNVERDDLINRVRFHQSVVSNESSEFGLPSSDLSDRHRFLNPTSRIQITRIQ